MLSTTLTLISLTLALFPSIPTTTALSSWYTPPGGPPVGSPLSANYDSTDKIRGVNLGGWFILEVWMMPSFVNSWPFNGTDENGVWQGEVDCLDEWTFCEVLGEVECQKRLEEHWGSWIVEDDFKRMSDYSLNTVRISVSHWIWNKTDSEPYLTSVQLPYLRQALIWASEYGLDVVLDMHTAPGSQSCDQSSGLKCSIEQFSANTTNLDRAVDAVGQMVAFATADEFEGVVKAIELLNEPYIEAYLAGTIPWDFLVEYMVAAYSAVRTNEYIQPGYNESMVVIHDAFQPLANWNYFFSTDGNAWTNYAVDTHIYQAWDPQTTDQAYIDSSCYQTALIAAQQESNFPVIVGEWSLGVGTACVYYTDCWNWTLQQAVDNVTVPGGDTNVFMREFWEVQTGAYDRGLGWIFWSWRNDLGPAWSYEQSVAQEWIPVDPSEKLYTFDASASSGCLSNYNYSDVPAYPTYAVTSIASGTATPKLLASATSSSSNSTSTGTGLVTASSTGAFTAASNTASASSGSASVSATSTSATSGTRPALRIPFTLVAALALSLGGVALGFPSI